MTFKKISLLLWAAMAPVLLYAQQKMGAVATPQINSTYYVGTTTGFYPTIQSAVTAACAVPGARVSIPAGSTPSDTIAGVTGGCATVGIEDQRNSPSGCYVWDTSKYAACASENIFAGTPSTPSYPASIANTNQLTPYQFNSSRSGRVSAASMPQLLSAMANYNFTTQPPIYIFSAGSSVSVSANVTDPADNSPCGHFVADLKAQFPGPGGLGYNFRCINMGVNGSTASQFQAAWGEYSTYALSGVAISAPGTGYAVGDWETVNQTSANQPGGAIIVTAVSTGGVPTAIAISPYPGCITEGDTSAPSTSLYSVASSVPTANGTPTNCSISEQTGTGSGLTVNITQVGYPAPAAGLLVYGMNDRGPLLYNSGETFSGGVQAVSYAIQTLHGIGSDAVVLTSVHPPMAWAGPTFLGWNAAIPCYDSDFMSVCDPSTTNNTSSVNQTTSLSTGDFGHLGTPIVVDSRTKVINSAYREVAAKYRAALIDSELYWFEALECMSQPVGATCFDGQPSQGSQTAAEQYLFNVIGPHPNTIGHQISYQRSIDDFVASLALQSAEPSDVSDFPYSPDGGTIVNRIVSSLSGSTPVNFTIPANTGGNLRIYARTQGTAPSVLSDFGYSASSNGVSIGFDKGTNAGLFSTTVSGLTVTLTPNAGYTYFGVEIDTLTTSSPGTQTQASSVSPQPALLPQAVQGSYNTYDLPNAGASGGWVYLGTWIAKGYGGASADSLQITINSGSNYASGYGTETSATLTAQIGNNSATPNLNGIHIVGFGETNANNSYAPSVEQVLAYATGGSTSATNASWDIYIYTGDYAAGTYVVNVSGGATWTNSGTLQTPPATAGASVVNGNVYVISPSELASNNDQVTTGGGSNLAAGATVTIQLPNQSNGGILIGAYQGGVAASETYQNLWSTGPTPTLGTPNTIGSGEFTVTLSGTTLTITAAISNENISYRLTSLVQ